MRSLLFAVGAISVLALSTPAFSHPGGGMGGGVGGGPPTSFPGRDMHGETFPGKGATGGVFPAGTGSPRSHHAHANTHVSRCGGSAHTGTFQGHGCTFHGKGATHGVFPGGSGVAEGHTR
jgi:hypothetical protein